MRISRLQVTINYRSVVNGDLRKICLHSAVTRNLFLDVRLTLNENSFVKLGLGIDVGDFIGSNKFEFDNYFRISTDS
jgi:hypothetical protein